MQGALMVITTLKGLAALFKARIYSLSLYLDLSYFSVVLFVYYLLPSLLITV